MFFALLVAFAAPAFATDPPEEDDVTDLDAEEGTLPDGAVAQVMGKSEAAVLDCSRRYGSRSTHGRIEFAWEIKLDGTVAHAKIVETGLKNPLLEECLLTAVQKLEFPKPRGGTVHTKHAFSF
jgi:hypothetical protein